MTEDFLNIHCFSKNPLLCPLLRDVHYFEAAPGDAFDWLLVGYTTSEGYQPQVFVFIKHKYIWPRCEGVLEGECLKAAVHMT